MTSPADPSERDRERVLGLCVRLTGDPDVAQDLAQEALYEAWRSRHRLRDQTRRWEWLSGIARNVYRRWGRRRGREIAGPLRGSDGDQWEDTDGLPATRETRTHSTVRLMEDVPDEQFDVEVEFERSELSVLLDRAMEHLPPATRAILLARLVEDVPQREVAQRLGVSEGVVAVRLQRGKVRLREVLTSHLAGEAAAYGLVNGRGAWRETRMWCPACGAQRLLARFAADRHGLYVRCPDGACGHVPADWTEHGHFDAAHPGFFHGVTGFRPALTRVLKSAHAFHVQATAAPTNPAMVCGCGAPLRLRVDPVRRDITTHCARCGSRGRSSALDLFHALPPARDFWRQHTRVRTLPPVAVEHEGQPAIVLTLQPHVGGPRLDAVLASDTLALRALAGVR
jgi:RNA polymerase sigma factor (sigma-70 family)